MKLTALSENKFEVHNEKEEKKKKSRNGRWRKFIGEETKVDIEIYEKNLREFNGGHEFGEWLRRLPQQ